MKTIKSIFYTLLAVVTSVCATSCQDDFDAPTGQAPEATWQANTTIYELKDAFWQDTDNYADTVGLKPDGSHYIIKGRVISCDRSGNIFKNIVIQDATAAIAISVNSYNLYLNYRPGQEVVMDVTGLYLGKYAGLQQIGMKEWYEARNTYQTSFLAPEQFFQHTQLNGYPDESLIDTLTITQVPDASKEGLIKMQSQLVRLNNVTFVNGGTQQFATYHSSGVDQQITMPSGSNITLRTSGYSDFWNKYLPADPCDVVAICSYYSGSSAGWQLLLNDYQGIMNVGHATVPPGDVNNPYSVVDAIATITAGQEATGWVTGYIVGAVGPEVTEVRSNDDIEWEAPTLLANTIVVGQTPDTRDYQQCLIVPLKSGTDLYKYANLRDNKDAYKKQIWLSGKFAPYMGAYGVTGNTGSVSEFKLEGLVIETGEIPDGTGTQAAPYNVGQVLAKNPTSTTTAVESGVWVGGYIVGWANLATEYVINANTATWTTPATMATNIILGPTPDCTDISRCIGIQLPTGSVRSGLNLVDNPGNLHKKAFLKGDIMKYSGIAGLKNTSEFTLDGGTGGGDQPDQPVTPLKELDQNFEGITAISQLPGWKSVVISGGKAWYFKEYSGNTYAACTAYNGTDPADGKGYDSWLITPPMDMSAMTDKVMSFISQAAYSGDCALEVYALSSNDPATATKTRLNAKIATPPASGYSEWVNSGEISLASLTGTIYIGWRYTAKTSAASMTFCIDDVKIGVKGSGGGTGGGGSQGGGSAAEPSGQGTAASPYNVASVLAGATSSEPVWVVGYIVGWVDGQVYASGARFNATDVTSATNLILADSPDATNTTICIPVQLPSGAVRTALNLKDNAANLGRQVCLQGTLAKYFAVPGLKTVTSYKWGATAQARRRR